MVMSITGSPELEEVRRHLPKFPAGLSTAVLARFMSIEQLSELFEEYRQNMKRDKRVTPAIWDYEPTREEIDGYFKTINQEWTLTQFAESIGINNSGATRKLSLIGAALHRRKE